MYLMVHLEKVLPMMQGKKTGETCYVEALAVVV